MVNIELVGGPRDGAVLTMDDEHLDLQGGLPREIKARWVPLDSPEDPGRYVPTRKLTKLGQLIYQWSTLL